MRPGSTEWGSCASCCTCWAKPPQLANSLEAQLPDDYPRDVCPDAVAALEETYRDLTPQVASLAQH